MEDVLKQLGLSANEIAIVEYVIQAGKQSVTSIAKSAGLNRSYTYYAISRLMEKGLLYEIDEDKVKKYGLVEINTLIRAEQEKTKALVESLQKLSLQKKEISDTSVQILKGSHVLKTIFVTLMAEVKKKSEILYLGLYEDKIEDIEPFYLHKLLLVLKEKGVHERVIIRKDGKRLPYSKVTEYKEIDSSKIGTSSKIIYNNVVVEFIHGSPLYAVIITNKEIAESAKSQFEVFWNMAH